MSGKYIFAAGLLLVSFVMSCSIIIGARDREKAQKEVTPISGFPEASITIFPVTYDIVGPVKKHREFYDRLMGPAGQELFDVTDTLGLLLEEKGYDRFEMTDSEYRFRQGDQKTRAWKFAQFVKDLELKTDYALCTEFTLHIENGFQELHTVIVNTKGKPCWEDNQEEGEPEWDKVDPGNPEECCEVVLWCLTPLMDLDNLPEKELSDEKKKALQEMRAEQPPSPSESAAMEKREEAMKQAAEFSRVIIYPARVDGERTDQACAARLERLLNDAKLCQPTAAKTGPVLEGEGWPNEAKVLWRFARAAREYARQNPVDSDYVLFADYWFNSPDSVWAVHFAVCDRAGEWVIVDLQNNHHEDFQRIDPKTLEDCDRLVLERLKEYLR